MRKILLLASHLCSGSDVLYQSLNYHPRIQGYRRTVPNFYFSTLDFLYLTSFKHKLNNTSAIYMDELLYNFSLATKECYNICKFIYVIRRPEETLNLLVQSKLFNPLDAQRYYLYRLRRLCEMAKKTSGAIFLVYPNFINSLELIQNYLKLKEPIELKSSKIQINKNLVPISIVEETEVAFEKYFYFLKNQNLIYNL